MQDGNRGNRFAPPGTQVADVEGEVQPVRLWPPSGRIGRLRLLAYGLGLYVAYVALSAGLGVLSGATRGTGRAVLVVGIVLFVLYLVGAVVLLIQRSHDMGLSGWWTIAAFIPLVGLLWVFKGGTRGVNRWGAPPPPNGMAVRIFGLLLPAVVIVGIIAAVAMPSYVRYTQRAIAGPAR